VFDAKADALAVLAAAGAPAQALQVVPGGPPWFHPGRSGSIQIGPQNVLGHFGELHPRALETLNAEGPLVAFEVILEKIPGAEGAGNASAAGSPALALPAGGARFRLRRRSRGECGRYPTGRTERRSQAHHQRHGVDVYEGAGIEPGKKSIAITVTLQPQEKTMTDAEIEAIAARIVAEVGKRTAGVLRA